MGRIKPAWQQQREADLAKAREQYYATRTRSTATTVRSRKMRQAVYSSLNIKDAGASVLIRVPVSVPSFTFFGQFTGLGLQDPATVTDPVIGEPRGKFTPSKVEASLGVATPTASLTPWGSRVIRYTPTTTGDAQANYSAPFSTGATTPTPDTLDTKANTIYAAVKGNLGAIDYAKFYWYPEVASFSKN